MATPAPAVHRRRHGHIGSGRNEHGYRDRHRHADSSPVVCITGQVSSKVLGSDAFQEIDITGHHHAHHQAQCGGHESGGTFARTLPCEAFLIANTGRPGPVLVDITKDAQQASAEFQLGSVLRQNFRPSAGATITTRPNSTALLRCSTPQAPHHSRRPWHLVSGAMRAFEQFVRAGNYPVRHDPPRIGCFPADNPLNLGMMGMHGEAWVNNAIQEADLLIAVGMRFDDRVTGEPAHLCQECPQNPIEIDRAEINKNVKVDAALVGDCARGARKTHAPHSRPAITAPGFGMSPN